MPYIIWLLIFIITGCSFEEEAIPWTRFYINVSEFEIEPGKYWDSNFATEMPFDSFTHKFAPATIIFSANRYVNHRVNTGDKNLNEYPIKLPVGNYTIKGSGGISDNFKEGKMGYYINYQEVAIIDTTTIINIAVRPICSMILIVDENKEIENCSIYNPGYSYNFINKDTIYYSYLIPSSDTYTYVNIKDGTTDYLNTAGLRIGVIYKINLSGM